jgi:hypothetical protein
MKQSKNSFSVSFQIRWERIGKASRANWRIIATIVILTLRLVAAFIGK